MSIIVKEILLQDAPCYENSDDNHNEE
jgi:hypothetical protein